jgi:hypothetical protein
MYRRPLASGNHSNTCFTRDGFPPTPSPFYWERGSRLVFVPLLPAVGEGLGEMPEETAPSFPQNLPQKEGQGAGEGKKRGGYSQRP